LPVGAQLVPLDIDGYGVPSDWYLQLGGKTGMMPRGEIPLSRTYHDVVERTSTAQSHAPWAS